MILGTTHNENVRFQSAVKKVLKIEGGFSDRAADAGGKTNWGITWLTARLNGYFGLMKNMPLETALKIYKKAYWDKLNCVLFTNQAVSERLFDIGVNTGVRNAAKWIQRTLNALNRYQKSWNDIKVDGKIGRVTAGVCNQACLNTMTLQNVLKALNCLLGYHYIKLAEDPKRRDELNLNGWLNQRIMI